MCKQTFVKLFLLLRQGSWPAESFVFSKPLCRQHLLLSRLLLSCPATLLTSLLPSLAQGFLLLLHLRPACISSFLSFHPFLVIFFSSSLLVFSFSSLFALPSPRCHLPPPPPPPLWLISINRTSLSCSLSLFVNWAHSLYRPSILKL